MDVGLPDVDGREAVRILRKNGFKAPIIMLTGHEFNIGPYTFRPGSKLLLNSKGNKVRLTEKETAILRYLYRARQRPVSREMLLQEVWGYNSSVTTHTLETHIYRLRQKVEKDAASPSILITESGGYKLVP
jgi:DNA-binding response OmpR family regulator